MIYKYYMWDAHGDSTATNASQHYFNADATKLKNTPPSTISTISPQLLQLTALVRDGASTSLTQHTLPLDQMPTKSLNGKHPKHYTNASNSYIHGKHHY